MDLINKIAVKIYLCATFLPKRWTNKNTLVIFGLFTKGE